MDRADGCNPDACEVGQQLPWRGAARSRLLLQVVLFLACQHVSCTELMAFKQPAQQIQAPRSSIQTVGESLGKGILSMEYDGPVDGLDRGSCLEYFVLRTQASKCQVLQSTGSWQHVEDMTLEECSIPGVGMLFSIYTKHDTGAVFHASLVGPQIMAPPLTTCGSGKRDMHTSKAAEPRAIQHLLVPGDVIPGSYTLSVYLVFAKDFSFSKDRAHMNATARSGSMWQVTLGMERGHVCTYCNATSWPVCNSTYVRGTVLSKLNQTSMSSWYGRDRAAWEGRLHFQPKGCNFVPTKDIDLQRCFEKKHVCFVGDSHTRHLHNGLVDLLTDSNVHAVGNYSIYDVYASKHMPFFWESWGDLSSKKTAAHLSKCTHVLFNFGSWPLSHKAEPARWPAGRYAAVLTKAFHQLHRLQQHKPRLQVYWLPTPAHHWARMCAQSIDARLPPFVGLFNDIGFLLARRHGIPIINTLDITQPLYETAHDTVHHHYVGVSGAAMVTYVANVLCVQGPPHSTYMASKPHNASQGLS